MKNKNLVLAFIGLLAADGLHAQSDSMPAAPRDTAPHAAPAAAPPSPRVLELTAVLMPDDRATAWKTCKTEGAADWGCDSLVKQLHFDPAAKRVRALPCEGDSLASGLAFTIELDQRDVLLKLPTIERQYIMAKPNRCGRSCPAHPQCMRLTLKRERRSNGEEVYIYRDTNH